MLVLLQKVGKVWDKVEMAVGGLFLTLAVFIVAIEIIGRNLFEYSMIGADEIASFAVIWSVFFTASIGVKRNIHVRIDVLFYLVPPRIARAIDMLGTAISIFFTGYLTYSGWALMQESIMFGEVTMTMLRLPLWIPQAILPIGGFLLSVRLAQRLYYLLTTDASPITLPESESGLGANANTEPKQT
ncbi:MAG: TRAP transporter small permease [Burkholderiaceae bacterium]|nr:TRAP transporter small permease [Burkholderiaceae bacterium]